MIIHSDIGQPIRQCITICRDLVEVIVKLQVILSRCAKNRCTGLNNLTWLIQLKGLIYHLGYDSTIRNGKKTKINGAEVLICGDKC